MNRNGGAARRKTFTCSFKEGGVSYKRNLQEGGKKEKGANGGEPMKRSKRDI